MDTDNIKSFFSCMFGKAVEAFKAVPSDADDRNVKPSSGNTAVVSRPVTPAVSNNEAVMKQKYLENELHNFSDFMGRALRVLPTTLNLHVQSLPYGLDVEKISNELYTCKVYKKESGIPFEPSTYYGVLKKHLDNAFTDIRIHTENRLGVDRQKLYVREMELYRDYYDQASLYYGNADRYNFELRMAQEAFAVALSQSAYLLCRLDVLAYKDYAGYIILTIHCEA